jgi:tetratricopeptide (TPR) repeat protein
MAERREPELPPEQAEAATPVTPETSAAAVALALAGRRGGAKSDARLDEFLEKQSRMLELQMEHLHEQRALQVEHLADQSRHLRLRHFNERLTVALKLMTAAVGLLAAIAIGVMAWQAHEDHGLTIAAFSVPPDLASRGLTGQVVAARVLDHLSEMQAQTSSNRPASSYANNWGDDIKVEIPETGVSIGELNRYLREWLGHETRISGEVVRTPAGVSVTARAGLDAGKTVAGAEADMDSLIGQAAENLYAQTQPYRYAAWLNDIGRRPEAMAAYQRLAASGAPEDRPWAYAAWASDLLEDGDLLAAVDKARAATSLAPHLVVAQAMLAVAESAVGHQEAFLQAQDREYAAAQQDHTGTPEQYRRSLLLAKAGVRAARGDFAGNLADLQAAGAGEFKRAESGAFSITVLQAQMLASLHDISGAFRFAREHGLQIPPAAIRYRFAVSQENWPEVAAAPPPGPQPPLTQAALRDTSLQDRAIALAHLGRRQEADAVIAQTPLDCDSCVAARGAVANVEGDWKAADRWFAILIARNPSGPFPHEGRGRLRLVRGDADGAIADARLSLARGPKYAQAIELWGEGLLAKHDYAGATSKLFEADKLAPRWGRLHLMLGEALMRSGRYAEARAQYEAANGMDLNRSERAALNLLLARTASGPLHG